MSSHSISGRCAAGSGRSILVGSRQHSCRCEVKPGSLEAAARSHHHDGRAGRQVTVRFGTGMWGSCRSRGVTRNQFEPFLAGRTATFPNGRTCHHYSGALPETVSSSPQGSICTSLRTRILCSCAKGKLMFLTDGAWPARAPSFRGAGFSGPCRIRSLGSHRRSGRSGAPCDGPLGCGRRQ